MDTHFDCLVIGAGYAGSVAAREMAEWGGRRVLVAERRARARTLYDRLDDGILFINTARISSTPLSGESLITSSRFTGWRDYQHWVVANVHGRFLRSPSISPPPYGLSKKRRPPGWRTSFPPIA